MQDARYFRDQAALCLEIARQMSDGKTADRLRTEAADHFALATSLENQTGATGSGLVGPAAQR